MKRFILAMFLVLLLLSSAEAATIKGTVYDISLEKLDDVKIGIDTEPRQQVIAKNGTYQFSVPQGSYTLTAFQLSEGEIIASVQEEVTISSEGEFLLDLILFPNFEEDLSFIDEVEAMNVEDPLDTGRASVTSVVLIILIALLVAAGLLYVLLRQNKKEEKVETKSSSVQLPTDLQEVLSAIKEAGGRISQKDLRKKFPLSEGKISLMISDLEHRDLVEKIKKGRGNIIKLK